MAPSNKQAKSATAHSGRFSLRIAIRSPRFNPHLTSARLTPTTCLYKSREDSDAHCGVVFRIITRDSSRSTAEKKMSLRSEERRVGKEGRCLEWEGERGRM